ATLLGRGRLLLRSSLLLRGRLGGGLGCGLGCGGLGCRGFGRAGLAGASGRFPCASAAGGAAGRRAARFALAGLQAATQPLAELFAAGCLAADVVVRHFHSVVEIVLHDRLASGPDPSRTMARPHRCLVPSESQWGVSLMEARTPVKRHRAREYKSKICS